MTTPCGVALFVGLACVSVWCIGNNYSWKNFYRSTNPKLASYLCTYKVENYDEMWFFPLTTIEVESIHRLILCSPSVDTIGNYAYWWPVPEFLERKLNCMEIMLLRGIWKWCNEADGVVIHDTRHETQTQNTRFRHPVLGHPRSALN